MLQRDSSSSQHFSVSRFGRTLAMVIAFIAFSACSALLTRPVRVNTPTVAAPNQVAELINDQAVPVVNQETTAQPVVPIQPDPIDEIVRPFATAALQARAARAQKDADYAKRLDPDLNKNRINFLLFGYGETYEPPHEKDTIGTITILSWDYHAHKIAQISLTHDARAPEIERYLLAKGLRTNPSRIDQTYRIGGFELMRLAVENATGLVMDFQVVVEDVVIKNLVDEVLGAIEVENPLELWTNPIYLQGVRYAGEHFPKGRQTFNGLKTMAYLKGLSSPPYDPAKENNLRKQVILRSLSQGVESNIRNPLFTLKLLSFLRNQLERKSIQYDFDISALLLNGLRQLAANPPSGKLTMPSLEQNIYLVDERFGDGGFTWVMGTQNPIIKDELRRGIYKDTAMVVTSGNPYAENLATGYWGSVRAIVRSRLLYGTAPWKPKVFRCGELDSLQLRGRNRARCGS